MLVQFCQRQLNGVIKQFLDWLQDDTTAASTNFYHKVQIR